MSKIHAQNSWRSTFSTFILYFFHFTFFPTFNVRGQHFIQQFSWTSASTSKNWRLTFDEKLSFSKSETLSNSDGMFKSYLLMDIYRSNTLLSSYLVIQISTFTTRKLRYSDGHLARHKKIVTKNGGQKGPP